ncbi:MAG: DNA repair protein RadC [Clostridia bacterium]|nr:DNA repair protein RadC [Clostridia bacterium]
MIDIPDMDRLTQHEGHRQRLKKRFVKDGFDHFEPHMILEMALFYTSPRQDTNGLAHDLIARFGSLAGVCDAPFDVLRSIRGVGDETAVFLKMIPEFARMYSQSRQAEKTVLLEPEDAVAFFEPRFLGRTNEVFMAAFLNARAELISCEVLSEGGGASVVMDVPSVTRSALMLNAAAVIVAHNHPRGFAVPSAQDLTMTDQLASSLSAVGVKLCDHIIFSRDDYMRMSQGKNSRRDYYVFSKSEG